MDSRQVRGLPAIAADDGAHIGRVARAFLDPAAKQVVGFAIDQSSGPLAPEVGLLADTIEVRALGPGALVLVTPAPAGAATAARYGDLIDLDALRGREVVTESGDAVGRVAAVTFDERVFTLTELAVAGGPAHEPHAIAPGRIITLGPDVVVVARGVITPAREPAMSEAELG